MQNLNIILYYLLRKNNALAGLKHSTGECHKFRKMYSGWNRIAPFKSKVNSIMRKMGEKRGGRRGGASNKAST